MIKKSLSLILLITIFSFSLVSCSTSKASNENTYTGTVECETYNVSSEVSGQVSDINITEGSVIKAGDKVATLDTKTLELQKNQAAAALKIAKAKQSGIPGNAKTALKDEAQGAVDQAQAALDLAQLQVDKSTITSSVDGTVTDVLVHKGELVSPGMNIAKLSDMQNKYIKIYIEESKRTQIKLNDSLTVSLGNKSEKAKVIYISSESEFTPKNVETKNEKENTLFEVKLALQQNSAAVPGLMADVSLK